MKTNEDAGAGRQASGGQSGIGRRTPGGQRPAEPPLDLKPALESATLSISPSASSGPLSPPMLLLAGFRLKASFPPTCTVLQGAFSAAAWPCSPGRSPTCRRAGGRLRPPHGTRLGRWDGPALTQKHQGRFLREGLNAAGVSSSRGAAGLLASVGQNRFEGSPGVAASPGTPRNAVATPKVQCVGGLCSYVSKCQKGVPGRPITRRDGEVTVRGRAQARRAAGERSAGARPPGPQHSPSSLGLWTSPHSNPVLTGLHRLLSNPQASSTWFSNADICSVLEE